MTITTCVEWGAGRLQLNLAARDEGLAQCVSAGTTDGAVEYSNGVGIRTWTTEEAATAWVAFLNTFEVPPISAVVEIL